jgi:hypothetical protein
MNVVDFFFFEDVVLFQFLNSYSALSLCAQVHFAKQVFPFILLSSKFPFFKVHRKRMNADELRVKIASASIGSLLVSLTTTPLDVIKTRLQSGHVNTSIKSIVKYEGLKALWRGLTPSMLMTTPATVLYYVGYESLRNLLISSSFPQINSIIIAGCSARCM